MAIRVGRWDCPVCGFIGNIGPSARCEKCGSSRPVDVKFYLPDDSDIVIDNEIIKDAKSGVDWICSYCGVHNKAIDNTCKSCGVANIQTEEHTSLKEQVYDLENIPKNSSASIIKTKKVSDKKKKPSKGCLIALGVFFVLFLLFFILSLFKSEITVELTEKKWERTLKVEKFDFVIEEDWSVPSSGIEIESFKAIHHYNKISKGWVTKQRTVRVKTGEERYICGSKDLGNGYFEDIYCTRDIFENRTETYQEEEFEQVPVYATKYKYRIKKWTKDEPAKAGGTSELVFWPSLDERKSKYECRVTDTIQNYWIIIVDHKNQPHEEKCSYKYWTNLKIGDKLTAEKSKIFGVYYGLKEKISD